MCSNDEANGGAACPENTDTSAGGIAGSTSEDRDIPARPALEPLLRKLQLTSLVAAMTATGIGPEALTAAYEEAAGRHPAGAGPTGIAAAGAAEPALTAAGLGSLDVAAEAFLVMKTATRDMDEDLKEIMAEIKAMTAAKQRMRQLISDLNQWISGAMSGCRDTGDVSNEEVTDSSPDDRFRVGDGGIAYSEPHPNVEAAGLVVEVETRYSAPRTVTIRHLRALLDELKTKLDGMNEMSEMTSLRLQMTMDRRSKFVSTLSQMMKKISTTQDLLVQNLK